MMVENAFRAWQAQPTNVSDDARAAPHLKPSKGWQSQSFNELRLQHMMRCVDAAQNLTEYYPASSQTLVDPTTGVVVETTQATLRYLAGPFMELPDPETSPEYYRVIAKPMSISTIRAKIESCGYTVWNDMRADVLQVWNLFNSVPGSDSESPSDSGSVSSDVSDCSDLQPTACTSVRGREQVYRGVYTGRARNAGVPHGRATASLRETGAAGGHEEGGAALAERLFHAAQAERARALSRHSERPAQLEQQHLAAQLEQEHLATSAVLSSNIRGVQAAGTQQAGQDSAAAGAGW